MSNQLPENFPFTLFAYVMRHGKKGAGDNDLAALTPEGIEQVQTSARTNLGHRTFDGLYASDLYRAGQTVWTAVGELPQRNNGLGLITRRNFGYLTGDPEFQETLNQEYYAAADILKRLAPTLDYQFTVGDWLTAAPIMTRLYRERFAEALRREAIAMAESLGSTDRTSANILIGSHSPCGETACLNPDTTPALREADIIRYTLEVKMVPNPKPTLLDIDNSILSATIVASEYLSRGF